MVKAFNSKNLHYLYALLYIPPCISMAGFMSHYQDIRETLLFLKTIKGSTERQGVAKSVD